MFPPEHSALKTNIGSKWKERRWHSKQTADKTDPKRAMREKDGECMMIKGTIHQECIKVNNIYPYYIGAPKYVRQLLTDLQKETDSNTVIVQDFNTPLTSMDRSSR